MKSAARLLPRAGRHATWQWRGSSTGAGRSPAEHIAHQLTHDPAFVQQLLDDFSPDECRRLAQRLELVPPAPEHEVPSDALVTEGQSEPLTRFQIRWLFLRQFVPFIAFGASSNAILLLTGDAIDRTLGVALGLTALCSAGLANAVSDTIGMLSTAPIQRLTDRLRFPEVRYSPAQESAANLVSSIGQISGMILGCLLGMFALFFISDRQSPTDAITAALSPDQRLRMSRAMQKTSFAEGEHLLKFGEPGEWLHLILEGEADIVARDSAGNPVKVGFVRAGDVVGELEIIHSHPSLADVIATSPVRTQRVRREDALASMGPALTVLQAQAAEDAAYAWYRARWDGHPSPPTLPSPSESSALTRPEPVATSNPPSPS